MIEELYRSDYEGEFVVTGVTISNGKKEQQREWVENPIQNLHDSNRATCLANGPSIDGFPVYHLEAHRGGLLGSISMQTYGVNDIYNYVNCDFLITLDKILLEDIIEKKYDEDNVVYSNTRNCLDYQGHFYLIPQNTRTSPHATAVWLACFDGHEEVFLFGYDQYDRNGNHYPKLVDSVCDVMKAYPTVKFYHVTSVGVMPEKWKYLSNVESMNTQQYISYCDIGSRIHKVAPKAI